MMTHNLKFSSHNNNIDVVAKKLWKIPSLVLRTFSCQLSEISSNFKLLTSNFKLLSSTIQLHTRYTHEHREDEKQVQSYPWVLPLPQVRP